MKIRRSFIHYLLPGFLALLLLATALSDSSEASRGAFVMCLGVVALCVIDYLTTYIEIKNGMVKGHTGLIRRQTLSTPISNLNGFEVKKFLCWNRVKITSGLTVITLKNMQGLDRFSAAVNRRVK